MDTTATHIAGQFIIVSQRVIQRCIVCGEKLVDCMADQEGQEVAVYPVACMIRKDDKEQWVVGEFPEDDVPNDFCIVLVEKD